MTMRHCQITHAHHKLDYLHVPLTETTTHPIGNVVGLIGTSLTVTKR